MGAADQTLQPSVKQGDLHLSGGSSERAPGGLGRCRAGISPAYSKATRHGHSRDSLRSRVQSSSAVELCIAQRPQAGGSCSSQGSWVHSPSALNSREVCEGRVTEIVSPSLGGPAFLPKTGSWLPGSLPSEGGEGGRGGVRLGR